MELSSCTTDRIKSLAMWACLTHYLVHFKHARQVIRELAITIPILLVPEIISGSPFSLLLMYHYIIRHLYSELSTMNCGSCFTLAFAQVFYKESEFTVISCNKRWVT